MQFKSLPNHNWKHSQKQSKSPWPQFPTTVATLDTHSTKSEISLADRNIITLTRDPRLCSSPTPPSRARSTDTGVDFCPETQARRRHFDPSFSVHQDQTPSTSIHRAQARSLL
jgi:hypothetical protein